MSDFTHATVTDAKDMAAEFGLAGQTAHFATELVGAEDAGFAYHRYEPNAKNGFGHRHENAEEVYVVINGSGEIKLGDEVIDVKRLDAVRVAPKVWRAFAAGPDGMEVLAFGAQHPNDGEVELNWWT